MELRFSATLEGDRTVIPFFKVSEFACPGEDVVILNGAALLALYTFRVALGKPIRISSGYRSKGYNAITKGSVENSQHISGRAFDMVFDYNMFGETEAMLLKAGFKEVEYYDETGHWHVGLDDA